jgi:2-iminoacetate synthase
MSFTTTWRQHDFAEVTAKIRGRTEGDVRRALDRVRSGLTPDDLAALLSPAAAPHLEDMARLAHQLTVERFGCTMQLYAPMYLTNICANV